MCTLEFCFSGDCLYFRDFGKLHQVAVSVHSFKYYISTSFALSVLVCLFRNTPLTAIPHLQFLHAWQSTVSATVMRQTFKWRLQIYIYCKVMEKETIFWNRETMVYLLFPKVVSFQNPLRNTCNLPFKFDTRCPRKGPKKCTWHLIYEQETVTEKEIRVYSHASCSVKLYILSAQWCFKF